MRTSPRGILLDFYGTVVHEDDEVLRSVCAEAHAGLPDRNEVSVQEIGRHWSRTFSALREQASGRTFRTQRELEHRSLGQTVEHFRSAVEAGVLADQRIAYWRRPTLFPDARTFLELAEAPVCLVSDVDRAEIEAAVEDRQNRVATRCRPPTVVWRGVVGRSRRATGFPGGGVVPGSLG